MSSLFLRAFVTVNFLNKFRSKIFSKTSERIDIPLACLQQKYHTFKVRASILLKDAISAITS